MPRRRQLEIPELTWDQFLGQFVWKQGEHLSGIGPTGGGKTSTVLELVHHRAATAPKYHVSVICTKPKDDTMRRLLKNPEWVKLREWPPAWNERQTVFWPQWRGSKDDKAQQVAIRRMLDDAFAGGNRTVVVDELAYLCRKLRMENVLKDWWQQGRSVGLTLVGLVQRPAWVPLDLYNQATHLLFWRTQDDRDLKTISGLGGLASQDVRDAVSSLAPHEVLYVNTRTGQLARFTPTLEVTR